MFEKEPDGRTEGAGGGVIWLKQKRGSSRGVEIGGGQSRAERGSGAARGGEGAAVRGRK